MKILRSLLILIIAEIILCGLLIIQLSTVSEFTTDMMMAGAIQMLAFFVGMLCIILFVDGIFYMHRMNTALNTAQSLAVYQHDAMLQAMDMIESDTMPTAIPARYAMPTPNQNDVAA